jgi:hypothetical protein
MLISIPTNNKTFLRIRSITKNGFLIQFSWPIQISSLFHTSRKLMNIHIFGLDSKLAPQRCHNRRLVQVRMFQEIRIIYSDSNLLAVLGQRIWDTQKIPKYLEFHASLRVLSRVPAFSAIYTRGMIQIPI